MPRNDHDPVDPADADQPVHFERDRDGRIYGTDGNGSFRDLGREDEERRVADDAARFASDRERVERDREDGGGAVAPDRGRDPSGHEG